MSAVESGDIETMETCRRPIVAAQKKATQNNGLEISVICVS
jgi:hypothetical protein